MMSIRFNEEWLNEPTLADWLVRVSNDEARAYCRFCAIVLRAHKSDLTSHATTAKHLKNVATSSNAPTGPISVQIIVDDNQPTTPTQGGSGLGDSRLPGSSGGRIASPRIQYPKRYRVEWEEIEEFKGWLAPDPNDTARARCKICAVQLRAHKHDLLLHSRSSKHRKCCDEFGVDEEGNFINTSYEGAVGEDGECLETQKVGENDGEGQEDGTHLEGEVDEQVIGPDIKQDPDARKSSGHNIIRVAAPSPRASPVRYGKRRRFNVTDVIDSIHQNHFTGYELLQICKAAIPKL